LRAGRSAARHFHPNPQAGRTRPVRLALTPPRFAAQLGSRLDAVVSRLETQSKMNLINKSFAGIVKSLERALASNNLTQVATTMDQFEKAFENLDVQSEVVENAMGASTALSTPADQVSALMQQVAEEHNLELALELPNARPGVAVPAQAAPVAAGDDLSRRLAELKAR
jgi:charged multivesicular body protein 1